MTSVLLFTFTSCEKDYIDLEGEFGGGNGGGTDVDASIKSVTKTSCNFKSISFDADGAVTVATRAAATKDGSFVATTTHNLGLRVEFSDNTSKDTTLTYNTVAKANFFGLKPRYMGSVDKVFDVKTAKISPTVVGDMKGFKLDCQGKIITMLLDDVIPPTSIKFVINGKQAAYQGDVCYNQITNLVYTDFRKVQTQETAEYRGYKVFLLFDVLLENGKGQAEAELFAWEAKNGIDPDIPEDDKEVVKITENASDLHTCVRDTTRLNGHLLSNMMWNYSLHYLYSDGSEKDSIVVNVPTKATLGLHAQELPTITVKSLEEYQPNQTSYRKGDVINNSQVIFLGIDDIEKSMTATWTTYTHVDGKVERPVLTFGRYVDFSFDKAGSYTKKVSDKEYVYYHRIVTTFSDGKLPQETFWTRTIKLGDVTSIKDWKYISVKEVKSNNVSHWEIIAEITYSNDDKVNRKVYAPSGLRIVTENKITAKQETETVVCANAAPTGSATTKIGDFSQDVDGLVGEKLSQNYGFDFTSFPNNLKLEYNGNLQLTIEGITKTVPLPKLSLAYSTYTQNKGVDVDKTTVYDTKLQYGAFVEGQNGAVVSGVQDADIVVNRKNVVTGYDLISENIVLTGNQYFRDLKFTEHNSVDGDKDVLKNRNMNMIISDNGLLKFYENFTGGVTANGNANTNQVSAVNNDNFTGFTTRTTRSFTVGSKTATININLEEILSYANVALGTYVPSVEAASELEVQGSRTEGQFTVNSHNIVYTISVDGKSITYRQSVEIWTMPNTIPDYEVDSRYTGMFAWADLYNSGRTGNVGTAICGIFRKIDDNSQLILAAFNSDGTPMIQDGNPIRIAINSTPPIGQFCALVWNNGKWDAGRIYGDGSLTTTSYTKGFEYMSLNNPAIYNNIGAGSIAFGKLRYPIQGVATWDSTLGVVSINGIYFK